MPFHFCADELMMLLAAIPFLGVTAHRVHAWYLKKFPKHTENCHDHRNPPPSSNTPIYDGPQSFEELPSKCFEKSNGDE